MHGFLGFTLATFGTIGVLRLDDHYSKNRPLTVLYFLSFPWFAFFFFSIGV